MQEGNCDFNNGPNISQPLGFKLPGQPEVTYVPFDDPVSYYFFMVTTSIKNKYGQQPNYKRLSHDDKQKLHESWFDNNGWLIPVDQHFVEVHIMEFETVRMHLHAPRLTAFSHFLQR